MNLIAEILTPDRIRIDMDAGTRSRVFEEAGRICAAPAGLNAMHIVDSLEGREKMGSTGLGQGVAFPHARVKGLR